MRERPILFSAPMVRAILAGTKTQTRRVVKLPHNNSLGVWEPITIGGSSVQDSRGNPVPESGGIWHTRTGDCLSSPYGVTGDRLRVKEASWMWCERRPNGITRAGRQKWRYIPMREAPVQYQADHPKKPSTSITSPDTGNLWSWRLKIGRFLPKWASRITLEVTAVRVERLQDISEQDAESEGSRRWADEQITPVRDLPEARLQFLELWESINGRASWDANPWVWIVEFRKCD